MLANLLIKNYALIKHLEMTPSESLNIITGETGAGKSIMLGAVGLLLGNRADTKSLLNADVKCIIEGEFSLGDYKLKGFFEHEELDYEERSIIRREISPSGKSRAFVNDTPVTLDVLKKLGRYLMDVHSQHDTLLLGSNSFQLDLIDAYAQNDKFKNDFKNDFEHFSKIKKQLSSLLEEAGKIKKEADYNNFLLEELVKANLQDGEDELLEDELKVLENAEAIKSKLNEALEILSSAEFPIDASLQSIINQLSSITKYSEKYKVLKERVDSVYLEVRDIIEEVEKEDQQVEFDFDKTEVTKDRLSLIYQLQQKHQVSSIKELLAIKDALQEKADQALNLDGDIASMEAALTRAEENMAKSANKLSLSRTKVFEKVSSEIQALLRTLGMPDAILTVEHQLKGPGQNGIDHIALKFSANKGLEPQELKQAASGGEFSRLMFCIKYVLADKTALPTIVFDEIDTGISGEVALKLGKMMQKMAKNHQVIAISHLPQIAAKGHAHYFVYKDNSTDKAISKIRPLNAQERVEEIAKMIGGDNPSEIAFENARELIMQ